MGKMCDKCGQKHASFGMREDRLKKWCAGCGKGEGAINLTAQMWCGRGRGRS
jgi:hypothetical protein